MCLNAHLAFKTFCQRANFTITFFFQLNVIELNVLWPLVSTHTSDKNFHRFPLSLSGRCVNSQTKALSVMGNSHIPLLKDNTKCFRYHKSVGSVIINYMYKKNPTDKFLSEPVSVRLDLGYFHSPYKQV